MFEKRIIVGGLPRSGSTLLRFMLDSSSDIISGPETSFFTQPLHKWQSKIDKVANRLATKLELQAGYVQECILDSHSSFDAFDKIMFEVARLEGISKSAWAEKSPDNCMHYGRLLIENPEAYFISTIRHGLDVTTSIIADHPKRGGEYWCTVQMYADCMPCIFGFTHPRHMIIRYENMVSEPEATLDRLSEFLGISLDKNILKTFNTESRTRNFSKVNQPKLRENIQSTWINRFQDPKHQAKVEEFMNHPNAAYWLEKSGYDSP